MLPSGFRSTVRQRLIVWSGALGMCATMIAASQIAYHARQDAIVSALIEASAAHLASVSAGINAAGAISGLEEIANALGNANSANVSIPQDIGKHVRALQQIRLHPLQALSGNMRDKTRAFAAELLAVADLAPTATTINIASEWKTYARQLKHGEQQIFAAMSNIQDVISEHSATLGSEAAASKQTYEKHMLLAGLITLLVLTQLIVFERLWLLTPIKRFTQALINPNERDRSYLRRHALRQDEIGVLGEALIAHQTEAVRRQENSDRERERLAQEVTAKQVQQKAAENFHDNIAIILSQLESHAGRMKAQSQKLAGTAADAERQTLVATASTAETTTSIESVSNAVSELSNTIGDIHRQTLRASEIVTSANVSIRDADAKSIDLVDRTQSIEKVIELIQSVAERTNLLSLNATIEAARAGEVGRGFAVVASEIKTLATQTSRATGEIRGQLQSIVDASEAIAGTIHGVVQSIGEINEVARHIATAAENQNSATRAIDKIAVRTAQTAQRLDHSIGGVAGIVADASKSAQFVQTISDDLTRQAAALRQSVEDFMQSSAKHVA